MINYARMAGMALIERNAATELIYAFKNRQKND